MSKLNIVPTVDVIEAEINEFFKLEEELKDRARAMPETTNEQKFAKERFQDFVLILKDKMREKAADQIAINIMKQRKIEPIREEEGE